jgi:hypothetical protein
MKSLPPVTTPPIQQSPENKKQFFPAPTSRYTLAHMSELSDQQVRILERLVSQGFVPVAFPLYAKAVGIRKGSCAALLDPVAGDGFRLFGEPCVLLDGNLTVRITEKGKSWFVWKKQRLEATRERIEELDRFVAELKMHLESRA